MMTYFPQQSRDSWYHFQHKNSNVIILALVPKEVHTQTFFLLDNQNINKKFLQTPFFIHFGTFKTLKRTYSWVLIYNNYTWRGNFIYLVRGKILFFISKQNKSSQKCVYKCNSDEYIWEWVKWYVTWCGGGGVGGWRGEYLSDRVLYMISVFPTPMKK